MNATMLIERENHIGADFYQRGERLAGVVGLYPDDESLELLVTAVQVEISAA